MQDKFSLIDHGINKMHINVSRDSKPSADEI